MPKRRINGATEFAPTTTSTLEVEKDVDNKWGTGFKRALGGATAGAFVFGVAVVAPSETGTVPEASADEIVLYCGMGDNNNCDIYRSQLEATGQIRPGIDTVHPVPSPNSIWPLGPVTAEESVRISMEEGKRVRQEAINAASPGEPVVERGYSLGTLPLVANANERTGGGPAPVGSVIADGGPVTDNGVFNPQNNLVETMLPIAGDLLNIPTHHRAPAGTIARGSEQDIWYNGSQQDLGRLIGQAMDTFMGPAHAVQHPDAFHHVWTDHNGVIHNTFPGLGTGGILAPGLGMGGAPVPQQLAESIKPIERVQDNPANFNPVRNVPPVTPEQFVTSPPPPEPAPLPVPDAMAVPPPPVAGQPMTPEQLAFAEQLRSAVSGVK